jgi:hypothetical protein
MNRHILLRLTSKELTVVSAKYVDAGYIDYHSLGHLFYVVYVPACFSKTKCNNQTFLVGNTLNHRTKNKTFRIIIDITNVFQPKSYVCDVSQGNEGYGKIMDLNQHGVENVNNLISKKGFISVRGDYCIYDRWSFELQYYFVDGTHGITSSRKLCIGIVDNLFFCVDRGSPHSFIFWKLLQSSIIILFSKCEISEGERFSQLMLEKGLVVVYDFEPTKKFVILNGNEGSVKIFTMEFVFEQIRYGGNGIIKLKRIDKRFESFDIFNNKLIND